MKHKLLVPILAGVAVLAGLGVFVVVNGNDTTTKNETNKTATHDEEFKEVKACELFTTADAKTILGEAATIGDNTDAVKSGDVSVDTCNYVNNATDVPSIRVITVSTRSALSKDGIDSNKAAFEGDGAAKYEGAQKVEGYGEAAYWIPSLGSLSVLEDHGHVWTTIVYGNTKPGTGTLDDAKKVADVIYN